MNALIVCFLGIVIVYLVREQQLTRQALLWWQAQQLEDRFTESERIRDHSLQSLFGIRRRLEQQQFQTDDELKDLIMQVHHCQQHLNQLSDRLFSAYAFDSLPLALKDLWSDLSLPESTIEFTVQGDCLNHEMLILSNGMPMNHYQGLLMWVRTLLLICLEENSILGVTIECASIQQTIGRWVWRSVPVQLCIQIAYQDSVSCARLVGRSDLRLFCRGFQRLMLGHCLIQQQESRLICVMSDRAIYFPNLLKGGQND